MARVRLLWLFMVACSGALSAHAMALTTASMAAGAAERRGTSSCVDGDCKASSWFGAQNREGAAILGREGSHGRNDVGEGLVMTLRGGWMRSAQVCRYLL
eukprot:737870-Rhodomonas_salina.3